MKKKINLGVLYTAPITFWLGIFFVIPMLIVLTYSFLKKGTYGGVELEFSLEAFSIFQDTLFFKIL
ncbi:MAG: ABC transporter permease, partial [Fusobacteriaceae bacterium]